MWLYIHSQCLHYGKIFYSPMWISGVRFFLPRKRSDLKSYRCIMCSSGTQRHEVVREYDAKSRMSISLENPLIKKNHTSPWTLGLFHYKWDKTEYFLSESEIVTDGPCQRISSAKNLKWSNPRSAYCKSGEDAQCTEHSFQNIKLKTYSINKIAPYSSCGIIHFSRSPENPNWFVIHTFFNSEISVGFHIDAF